MNKIKINDLFSSVVLGGWAGVLLLGYITRSETGAIIGGIMGAVIQVYQDQRERKKNQSSH